MVKKKKTLIYYILLHGDQGRTEKDKLKLKMIKTFNHFLIFTFNFASNFLLRTRALLILEDFFFICFVVLEKEPKASQMIGTCSTRELYPQPLQKSFFINNLIIINKT